MGRCGSLVTLLSGSQGVGSTHPPRSKLEDAYPRPFGVFYAEERFTYEDLFNHQIQNAIDQKGEGDLQALISGSNTWEIK